MRQINSLSILDIFIVGLIAYYLSSMAIFSSVMFGHDYLIKLELQGERQRPSDDYLSSIFRMDALNYEQIAEHGYRYQVESRSSVAFFPMYPQLSSLIAKAFNVRHDIILLVSTNLFFAAACILLAWLCSRHVRKEQSSTSSIYTIWSLAVFCLFPSTFFFRLPYAESLLCFFLLLLLVGIECEWPLFVLAIISGAATATRPVGIALAFAFWWHFLKSYSQNKLEGRRLRKILTAGGLVLISCWGLFAYMSYLWCRFDSPLAFAQTQSHWIYNAPVNGTLWDKAWSLITLEPIRGIYDPESSRYWARGDTHVNPLFSIMFWNPILYLCTWIVIGFGAWKRWLTSTEIILSIGLLVIPYLTRGYEMSMASHARFAAVVIPQYFVLGRLFSMISPAIAGCLCGLMGLMLGLWTALFAAGYGFF